MPINTKDLELKLRIIALDYASKILKEVGKETTKLGKETTKLGTTTDKQNKDITKSLNHMLTPIMKVRRAMYLVQFASFLAFGSIIKSVIDASKEIADIEKKAISLGLTFESYSQLRYGYIFDKKVLYEVSSAWRDFGESLHLVKLRIAELVAQKGHKLDLAETIKNVAETTLRTILPGMPTLPVAQIVTNNIKAIAQETKEVSQKMTDEQISEYATLINKTEEYYMTTAQLSKKALDNEYIRIVNILELQKKNVNDMTELEYDKHNKQIDLLNKWYNQQENIIQRATWGFKSYSQEVSDVMKEMGQKISKTFSEVFIDGLDNKFQNARQIVYTFIMDIRNMFIRSMTNQMLANIGTSGEKFFKNLNIPFLSTTGTHAFGTNYVASTGIAQIHKGEQIVSPYNSSIESQGTHNYFYIQAIDSRSFAETVSRNPEVIVSVVDKSIKLNQSYRKTIQNKR